MSVRWAPATESLSENGVEPMQHQIGALFGGFTQEGLLSSFRLFLRLESVQENIRKFQNYINFHSHQSIKAARFFLEWSFWGPIQETVEICPCLTIWKQSMIQSMIKGKNMPNNRTSGPVLGLNATVMEANRNFEIEAIYSWIKSSFIHKYQHILLPYVNITKVAIWSVHWVPCPLALTILFFSLPLSFCNLFPHL